MKRSARAVLIWFVLALALCVPLIISLQSPLLAWRSPIYIAAGVLGILALAVMVVQPLLIAGALPGISRRLGRVAHRWSGAVLVICSVGHVVGLWITSPPDVVDALLFRSPTPFAVWGVLAFWAVIAAAALAVWRRSLRPAIWRAAHSAMVCLAVIGTGLHAVQIEGTMGLVSKWALCSLAIATLGITVFYRRPWARLMRRVT